VYEGTSYPYLDCDEGTDGSELAVGVGVEGGGSSWAVTRLHIMIDLTGHRTRDLPRIRRALYRLTEKA
jgi:hypothetical protein